MKKLDIKQRIILAATLFGMFFGAGNLIFPVHLGQLAGSNYLPATIGFCLTAVGIPILGVAAIGNTYSDGLQDLANRVSPKYSIFFTLLLYLTIGPFFAIPRCATVSFTVGVSSLLSEDAQTIGLFIFSLVFFALALYFSLKPGKITVWIGKIINPLFLVFLFILIAVSLISKGPAISSVLPEVDYEGNAFFNSIIDGYETMDVMAGLAFGIVVVNVVKEWGIKNDSDIASEVLKSGIFTAVLMIFIYFLIIMVGVKSKGIFEISENGGIALRQIVNYYLGTGGSIILALTITLACLKTSIGLIVSCSETFEKMCHGKIKYRSFAIVIAVFAFAVSNFGLSTIITYSVPVLMLLYPLSITLVILALTGKLFGHNRTIYKSVTLLTLIAAIPDFIKSLPASLVNALRLQGIVDVAVEYLPLFNLNLGWIIPALIGFVIGFILAKAKKEL